jgi:hypothetical protein
MQSGEKRFARRLLKLLEDDYICWYETGVGYRPRYTDFIVLHPSRGLLLLEIKDWRFDTVRRANPDSFELLLSSGIKNVANPHLQARQCTYQLVNQLEKDPQLAQVGGKHKGKLAMPYGYGVVFTNITRAQFESAGLSEVIPTVHTMCKDEMAESMDAEVFQSILWDMFTYNFNRTLTQPQIDRVRWHLFPEIRMNPQPELALPNNKSKKTFEIPDVMKVMDIEQEKLARGLGAGHRVIHGVAGSGKTMILGYRCMHLAKLLHKPILVLCYNVTLAARLRSLIEEQGAGDQVSIYSIHRWAFTVLKSYNVKLPGKNDKNFDAAIEELIKRVGNGDIPKGQYGAILIDEGHDFKKEWLQLVVDMVDPDTKSLLLLYDDTQSIYNRSAGLGFTLKDVGVEAQGRSTILKLNYRNTEEILKFAFNFIDDYVAPTDGGDSGVPVIEPDSAGRHGSLPAVESFSSFEEEAARIIKVFQKLHSDRDLAWSKMCVLYCHNWMGKAVAEAMVDSNIPHTWLRDRETKSNFNLAEDTVKIVTMHSSKGLEFPTVAMCGVGSLGRDEDRAAEDAKLLYVAMTRATDNLLITSSRESSFTEKLQKMAEEYRKGEAA